MAEYQQRVPKLKPVKRNDGTWYVRATWRDAPVEPIGDFQSEAAAHDWIARKAKDYFLQRGKQ